MQFSDTFIPLKVENSSSTSSGGNFCPSTITFLFEKSLVLSITLIRSIIFLIFVDLNVWVSDPSLVRSIKSPAPFDKAFSLLIANLNLLSLTLEIK